MLLHRLIDAVAAHLTAVLPAATKVTATMPRVVADLPAVVLSVIEASPLGAGVGGQPAGLTTGALPLSVAIALNDPVLRFGAETVTLLSADRRTLQLPHSPLVDADGGDVGPLAPGAVTMSIGPTVITVVAGAPAANQVQVDRVTGIARFGTALPNVGTLNVTYFLGQWEADTARFTATLQAEVFANGAAALDTLSRQVAAALAGQRVSGLSQVAPLAWGAMAPPGTPDGTTLLRRQSWRCRFEYSDPRVITGGGPIRGVQVALTPRPGALPTAFTITHP